MTYENVPASTFILGGWSSSCNNCGKQTVNNVEHDVISGYGGGEPGCGIVFTHIICEYGPVHHAHARKYAAHLELIQQW